NSDLEKQKTIMQFSIVFDLVLTVAISWFLFFKSEFISKKLISNDGKKIGLINSDKYVIFELFLMFYGLYLISGALIYNSNLILEANLWISSGDKLDKQYGLRVLLKLAEKVIQLGLGSLLMLGP